LARREDNIRMEFRDALWSGTDRICLVLNREQQRAFLNTVMNLPYNVREFLRD
jgi:hypothetical protein